MGLRWSVMEYFQAVVRAIDFMEGHLCDDISVADVAKEARLSSWHFQRIFREALGETIGSYLRRRRLACAVDELQEKGSKVIDVAFKFQFGSSEAFSRAFKDEFQISPVQFKKSSVSVLPYRKPSLSASQVKYVMRELTIEPEIREVSSFSLIGLPVSVVSPLSKRQAYMRDITGIWKEFVRRQNEIPQAEPGIKVGAILGMASAAHHIHDEMMDYVAAAPAPKDGVVPSGFVSIEVPGGRYAVFTAAGFHEQTQFIIDYVYSTWLPQVQYERSEGVEFTWLDHRFSELSPITSKVEYFLPIR